MQPSPPSISRTSFHHLKVKLHTHLKILSKHSWFTILLISSLQHSDWVFIYVYISFSYSFSLWLVAGFWLYFPVLYSRILLFILYIYNHLPLLIPNPSSFPPQPHIPRGQPKSVLYMWLFLFCRYVDLHILDSTCKWDMVFVFFILTLLSVIVSRSIHVAANDIISFFWWQCDIPLCMCVYIYLTTSLSIQLLMDI